MKEEQTNCLSISVAEATKASSIHRQELLMYKSSDTIQNTFCNNVPLKIPQKYKTPLRNTGESLTQTQSSTVFSLKNQWAFRRPKSLKDILVRAQVTPRQESPTGESRPCNKACCQTCRLMPIAQTFKSRSGTIIAIKGRHTCKKSNAVYLMILDSFISSSHVEHNLYTRYIISRKIRMHF